jgi:hypothetical protein
MENDDLDFRIVNLTGFTNLTTFNEICFGLDCVLGQGECDIIPRHGIAGMLNQLCWSSIFQNECLQRHFIHVYFAH